jgi:hypothetical protein
MLCWVGEHIEDDLSRGCDIDRQAHNRLCHHTQRTVGVAAIAGYRPRAPRRPSGIPRVSPRMTCRSCATWAFPFVSRRCHQDQSQARGISLASAAWQAFAVGGGRRACAGRVHPLRALRLNPGAPHLPARRRRRRAPLRVMIGGRVTCVQRLPLEPGHRPEARRGDRRWLGTETPRDYLQGLGADHYRLVVERWRMRPVFWCPGAQQPGGTLPLEMRAPGSPASSSRAGLSSRPARRSSRNPGTPTDSST